MTRELGEDCQEPDVDNRSRNREARTARLWFLELSSHYEFRSSKRIQPVNVRFRASSVKADPWTARQRSGTMGIFHTEFHYVSGLCNWDMTIPIRATNKKSCLRRFYNIHGVQIYLGSTTMYGEDIKADFS